MVMVVVVAEAVSDHGGTARGSQSIQGKAFSRAWVVEWPG